MRATKFLVLSCVASQCFGSGLAEAQSVPTDAVTQHETAINAASDINLGSFTLRPQVEEDISYKSNIFGLDTKKAGDEILDSGGQISVNSNFNANSIGLIAQIDNQKYLKNSNQGATTYGTTLSGTLDITGRTKLSGDAGYQHAAESRETLGAFTQSNYRVIYNQYTSDLALTQDFNQFQASASGRFLRLTYDPVLVNGVNMNLASRNYSSIQGTGQITYGIQNLTRFVVQGSVEQRLYDFRAGSTGFSTGPNGPIDRSADGYKIEAGLQRVVTDIIQATLRIGYMHYKYHDSRLPVSAGLSYHADALWNVTPLTSVTIQADRLIEETVTPGFGGNEEDQFQILVNHELLRTLILSAKLRYAHFHGIGLLSGTIDPPSNELGAGVGAHYYVTPHIMLLGSYDHTQRTASVSYLVFHDDTFKLGIRLLK